MSNKKELNKFLNERMESQNKNNNELLPCPFCGSKNIYCFDAGNKTDVWFIQCDDCCATFPHFDSKQEAIDAWNKRDRISMPR